MNEEELSMFVEQVLADAERKFGPDADPYWLDLYAKEAVLDLWLDEPEVTLAMARHALCRLRETIARRAAADGRSGRDRQDGRVADSPLHGIDAGRGESPTRPAAPNDEVPEWLLEIA